MSGWLYTNLHFPFSPNPHSNAPLSHFARSAAASRLMVRSGAKQRVLNHGATPSFETALHASSG
jgi:hypothetical protein